MKTRSGIILVTVAALRATAAASAAPPSGESFRITPAAEIVAFPGSGAPESAAGLALTVRFPVSERLSVGVSAGYLETSVVYPSAGIPASVPLSRVRGEVHATWRLVDAGSLFALHAQGGAGLLVLRSGAHAVSLGALGERTIAPASESRSVVSVSLPLVFFARSPVRIEITPGILTSPGHEAWSTQYVITGGIGVALL